MFFFAADFIQFWVRETAWLSHVHDQFSELTESSNISWGSIGEKSTAAKGLGAMLPLFSEKSTSPGMIKHGLDLNKRITQHLHSGQVEICCMDQPLFALAKKLQWSKAATYGESRLVMLLGGFHIEKAFLGVLGQLLDKSSWVHIVANSGITTEGTAEAALKVK